MNRQMAIGIPVAAVMIYIGWLIGMAKPHFPTAKELITRGHQPVAARVATDTRKALSESVTRTARPSTVEGSTQSSAEAPSPTPSPTASPEKPSPSPARFAIHKLCDAEWNRVVQSPNEDLEKDLRERRGLFSQLCADGMLQIFSSTFLIQFLKDCQQDLENKEVSRIEARCNRDLPFVRALLTSELSRVDQNANQISDSDLINQVVGRAIEKKDRTLEEVRQTIQLAEELSRRDPNSYVAYKTKLIGLLVSELQFQEGADLTEYDRLFDEMLRFRNFDTVENPTPLNQAPELSGLDPDLIQLPFLRNLALGDMSSVERMASDYLENYPNSLVGASYLAEAYWRTGEEALAISTLRQALANSSGGQAPGINPIGASVTDEQVRQMLIEQMSRKPVDRIRDMASRF